MRRILLLAGLALGFALPAEAQQRTRLTVYSALENEQLAPFKQAAEAALRDIEIAWVRDSTGVITARLIAERAFLEVLDGSCRTPIAGLATLDGDTIHLRGEVLSLDGRIRHADALDGSAKDAEALGRELGNQLRNAAGEALLQHG